MSRDVAELEDEITERASSCGLPPNLLRAVYMREVSESQAADLRASALQRVDQFIVYALCRDTHYSRDRDLCPSVTAWDL